MKAGQYFALIIGIFLVLLGVSGFIPSLVTPPSASPDAVNLGYTTGYVDVFGLIPTNVLFSGVRVSLGLLGILSSISLGSARLFSGVLALLYGLLAVLGLFPPTQSALGLMPIFGSNILLHSLTGAIAAYFGFVATPNLAELGEDNSQKQATSAR